MKVHVLLLLLIIITIIITTIVIIISIYHHHHYNYTFLNLNFVAEQYFYGNFIIYKNMKYIMHNLLFH